MAGKKRKKKTKRKKKMWGLEAKTFPYTIREYMDQDYIDNLSDEEKQWLSNFNEEYYGNMVRPEDGVLFSKLKKKDRDPSTNEKAKKIKKSIYDTTNARNRDIYRKNAKFEYSISTIREYGDKDYEKYECEHHMIDMIDYKKKWPAFFEDDKDDE